MKKKLLLIISCIIILLSIMYAEYRYIMCNQRPYLGERGTVYIEMFGNVDEYYAESMEYKSVPIEYK